MLRQNFSVNTSLPNPVLWRSILLTQLLDFSFTVSYFVEWLWQSAILICLLCTWWKPSSWWHAVLILRISNHLIKCTTVSRLQTNASVLAVSLFLLLSLYTQYDHGLCPQPNDVGFVVVPIPMVLPSVLSPLWLLHYGYYCFTTILAPMHLATPDT